MSRKFPVQMAITVCLIVAAGCSKDSPPRSVMELVENPMLLEAALVRCTQNRGEPRNESECVNAREAVKLVEARKEAELRAEREELSRRKREALRRTQQAAAEARRRAIEAERLRKEAEYEAQFVEPPGDAGASDAGTDGAAQGNARVGAAPGTGDDPDENAAGADDGPDAGTDALPEEGAAEPALKQPSDLGAIREELQRRNVQDDEN